MVLEAKFTCDQADGRRAYPRFAFTGDAQSRYRASILGGFPAGRSDAAYYDDAQSKRVASRRLRGAAAGRPAGHERAFEFRANEHGSDHWHGN